MGHVGAGNIIFRWSSAFGRIIQEQAIRLRKEGPGQAKPEKSGLVMALYLYEMPQARCEARLRMWLNQDCRESPRPEETVQATLQIFSQATRQVVG